MTKFLSLIAKFFPALRRRLERKRRLAELRSRDPFIYK
jgi:hypothetical protein